MKIANIAGRAVLTDGQDQVDIERASGGRFGPDPQDVYEEWSSFRQWAASVKVAEDSDRQPVVLDQLEAPVPRPRQVFAIGLNYRAHAEEAGLGIPESPPTFTKFPSSLTGPCATVELPSPNVDWEVELVAVIGEACRNVSEQNAWEKVAGLMIGQDLSERVLQKMGPAPQFSLAKSFEGFSPTGPWVVTTDELGDPDDLALSCHIDGEPMQSSRTSDLIFSVPDLISRLSRVCPLYAGDLIFTGTPSGVGGARTPKRFLRAGETLTSTIEGLGEMTTSFVDSAHPYWS